VKSDDAKAVLKQLADGHPDILPTKEAKAALERLKK
jgi:TolA-binding protein